MGDPIGNRQRDTARSTVDQSQARVGDNGNARNRPSGSGAGRLESHSVEQMSSSRQKLVLKVKQGGSNRLSVDWERHGGLIDRNVDLFVCETRRKPAHAILANMVLYEDMDEIGRPLSEFPEYQKEIADRTARLRQEVAEIDEEWQSRFSEATAEGPLDGEEVEEKQPSAASTLSADLAEEGRRGPEAADGDEPGAAGTSVPEAGATSECRGKETDGEGPEKPGA